MRIDYSDDSFLAPRRYFYEQKNLTLLTVNEVTKDKPVRINGKINGNGFIYVDAEGIIHIENICDKHYCANGEEGNIEITENPTGEIPSVGKDTPMITLNGDSTIYVGIGGEYIEEGAKARTIGGEELEYTTEIKLNDEVVEVIDTSVENEYTITYSTTNKEETVSVTRKVIVVEMKPVITMTEPNENYVKEQEVLITVSGIRPNRVERFTVEIKKNGESISTEEVTGLSKTLSFTETGSYEVIVTATDNNGHTNVLSKTYRISNSVPVITVEPKEVTLKTSEVIGYNLKTGVTARDEIDGEIESSEIEVIGSLSPTEGTYIITYKVTNSVGNSVTETRTIIVEAKGLPDPGESGEIVKDVDGNERYAGGNPDNYVSFNGQLFRIIGLFNGQLKIRQKDYYTNGGIAWDTSNSNNWSKPASLNTELNSTYWNTIDSTYQAMVDQNHSWGIGGISSYNYTRSNFYSAENNTRWTGKVGLMTPADYGYASSNSSCTENTSLAGNKTEQADCSKNNWMFDATSQWTMIAIITNGYEVWYSLPFSGEFNSPGRVNVGYLVRPTLFLKSDIELVSGTGTESDPYILGDKTAEPILNYNSISSNDKWIKGTNITGYVTDVYDITKFSYEVIKNGTSLGETEVNVTGREGQISIPLQESGEYSIVLRATNSNGINAELTSGTYKIDTTSPTVGSISGNNSSWTASKTLSATLQDSNSGIAYYMWTTSSTKPTETTSGWTSVGAATTNYSFSGTVSSNGTYYLWAKDGAGNVSTTGQNVTISYIDSTTPSLSVSNYSGKVGDNVSISSRYSATYGGSGGYTTCRYNGSTISNINYFTSAGTYTVSCTAYGNNGRNSGSKSMTIALTLPGMTGNDLAIKNNLPNVGGGYRYLGTPSNYVKFGNDMYRIIGIFNGQMKIISDNYYQNTGMAFDPNSSQGGHGNYGYNDWAQAKLQTTLNTTYWNTIPANYQSMVDQSHVWNIGGQATYGNRSTFYNAERSSTKSSVMSKATWTGKVGLMYPSDYGYATSGVSCDTDMNTWTGSATCHASSYNWLVDNYNGQWTMTPITNYPDLVFIVDKSGKIDSANASYSNRVRPVLYLKSNVVITGGTGTVINPYLLSV